MIYRGYDYDIQVKQIRPAVGPFKFGADISFLAKLGPEKATRLHPDLGEALGVTEQEARAKYEEKLKKWIDTQK